MREPAVAGQFYADEFNAVQKQLEQSFDHEKGPGALPLSRSDKKIHGVVVPHAGYSYSGPCAAWAYKEIAEADFPDCFIIIGPNHFGEESGFSMEDWKTPFGFVKTHKDVVRDLKELTGIPVKEELHITEHSIEVQLPFLQFVNKDYLNQIRIVPLMIGRDIDFAKVGEQLYQYFNKRTKPAVFIISTDFTHYGPQYSFLPFETDVPNRITSLDKEAIDIIRTVDPQAFKEFINKSRITMCGYMPMLVYLSMLAQYEKRPKIQLLMHYLSGDLTKEYKNSVSYASLVVR